jgi:hypothetical protein
MFYKVVRKILEQELFEGNVDKIFEGKNIYSDLDISNIIDELTFGKSLQKGVITENPPSVYKLIKMISKDKDEKKVSIKLIETIRKYRNDIIHGKEIPCDILVLEKHLRKAYEDFTILEQMLKEKVEI